MANTDLGSSRTRKSTPEKTTETSNEKTTGGVMMTTEQLCILATFVVESARMTGVRDSSPDKTHCKNNYKLVSSIVEELMGE